MTRVVVLQVRWPEGYFTDKYPSLVISGYIYSVRGEPLTAGSWSYIQGSTRNCENEGTTDNLRCMLYSVYAALSVNSWWWDGEIERDDLTVRSCDDGRVVDEKERDGGWRWERYGGYERLWEIRSTTCLIGFRRPHIGVITCRFGTPTRRIGDGQLTRTRNSLSPRFSCWLPPSPLIPLFLVLNSTIT